MIIWGGLGNTAGSVTDTGGRYDPLTDAWGPTSTVGAPSARMWHSAVWTGSRMIVWGGNIGGPGTVTDTGASYDPALDTWTPISTVGAPAARQKHIAIWTGREMLVWGGDDNDTAFHNDGSRYDPVSDTWSPMTSLNAPAGREIGPSAVWTGRELIVWGGRAAVGGELADGGRYDPHLDHWTAVGTDGNPRPRAFHSAVWTGREMIVWGGNDGSSSPADTGDRYDPRADRWTSTSAINPPAGKVFHNAVWTGRCMIVWGGTAAPDATGPAGGAYDPALDTWTALSTSGAVGLARDQSCVWSGREMIVWGGLSDPNLATTPVDEGARYLPSAWPSDTWAALASSGAPTGHSGQTAVWSGREMIVWGGATVSGYLDNGGRYDPTSRDWTVASVAGAPSGRASHTAVWTGRQMIVWGGYDGGATTTGGRYDPVTDTWAATTTSGAPSARQNHTAVWTGREMIIWGGNALPTGFSTDDGARYDPRTDTWTPMWAIGAPSPRGWHSAVWTGREMIVWGGGAYAGGPTSFLGDGGRYDPVTDTWAPLSMTGAPSERHGHTAIWTGDRMFVWGGNDGLGYVNTGGGYSPELDDWTSPTLSGAPTARGAHSAVWTGSDMIIWGGTLSGYEDTGGRYSPGSAAWVSTTLGGAPAGRHSHSAVWTGSRMLVWGGTTNGSSSDSGGEYGGDGTPPVAGLVRDGLGADLAVQTDTTSVSANWSGFADAESGIARYEWAVGTSPGAADVRPFTDVGTATSATAVGLSLSAGATYYATVRALNGDGRTSMVSSNGVYVGNALSADSGCGASVSRPGTLLFGTGLLGLVMLLAAKRGGGRG